jgi:serine/threonine-protein kinase HipA
MNQLEVFLHADRVGSLERLPGAELRFTYAQPWVAGGGVPLSLSLPLRAEPYQDRECRPFFTGLLPEGDFLKAVARAFQVSAENSFSVLAEIGGECAGAVSLVAPGCRPPFEAHHPPRWLSREQLADILVELPNRPLLTGPNDEDEGVRLSLAGTQDKLPVLARGEQLGITWGSPPSTHIIKKPIANVPEMVVNEAYCMSLAIEIGLNTAEAIPISAGSQAGLLVKRYDRIRRESGNEVHRIHQEDFCQALGFLPAQKYEAEGGPGVATCAELLRRRSAAPAPDQLEFLDALLFNLMIGNADAHAKNYSLLLDAPGSPRLAPLYDLLSTRVYGRRFGRKMAMKYGGEYRPERIRGRHLDRMSTDLGVAARRVRVRAENLADLVIGSTENARRRLPEPRQSSNVIDGIIEIVEEMALMLRKAAAEPA